MHPIVKGTFALAVVLAASAGLERTRRNDAGTLSVAPTPSAPSTHDAGLTPPCPRGTIASSPTGCVALPPTDRAGESARTRRLGTATEAGRDPRDRPHALVELSPERPASYASYVMPVATRLGDAKVLRDVQDDGMGSPVLRLRAEPGAPVTLPELEAQDGAAEVVGVGDLYGVTVVTRHRVAGPGGERAYLVFFGELSRPGPTVAIGTALGPLAVVGFTGDSGLLRFAIHELRRDLASPPTLLADLVDDTLSFGVDVRNVLLRAP